MTSTWTIGGVDTRESCAETAVAICDLPASALTVGEIAYVQWWILRGVSPPEVLTRLKAILEAAKNRMAGDYTASTVDVRVWGKP